MDGSTLPHPLPDQLVGVIAQRFRVLAEPTRLRLLDALRDGPATVHELQELTGASQQNVSKHLAILFDAGMVHRAKHGTSVSYEIADPGLFTLCELVCGTLQRQLAELDGLLKRGSPR
ncbi:MAG: metalloregulator ArsR/SmtB family transcription factor [Actinomycetota bacterium]|jgi:DNA-binding transcriptional ArsR family regulator|nr:metalloregulator ArsR/SmtB family transcription factor [Actinomycetota bacterium]